MESTNSDLNLVCVQFPGVVKDDEKALQCLGGVRNISQVFSQPNSKRLGISYHPENPYIKKAYADLKTKAGVLFKVKVKRTILNNVPKTEILSTSVVGRVNEIFKFEALSDFQYLPVQKEESTASSPNCILENILPSGIDSLDFLSKPDPLFLIPQHFSRSEKCIEYSYTDKRSNDKIIKAESKSDSEDNLLKINRAGRSLPCRSCEFSMMDDLPTEPNQYYVNLKIEKSKICPDLEKEFDVIKQMFEERPIWSMNLIRYHTKTRVQYVKLILPCLGIRMKSGPWRMLWVRFGYDPRKNPEARKYQVFDFRIRLIGGFKEVISQRDSDMHSHKSLDRVKLRQSEREIKEGTVYFKPGLIPTQRQIFYQYCDVDLPEVQELVGREPPAGSACHPVRGWLPPDAQDLCREFLCSAISRYIQAANRSDLTFEQASSEESNSEGEDSNIQNEFNGPTTSNA